MTNKINGVKRRKDLQSWTKVLRHFTETNVFKLAIVFCIGMKAPFSSVPLPPTPNNVAKRFVHVYWFPTLKRGDGEATFHGRREENLHPGNKG